MNYRAVSLTLLLICGLQAAVINWMDTEVSEWRSKATLRADSAKLFAYAANRLHRRSDSLKTIIGASSKYNIAPDLARSIISHAYREGIDPKIAFELVQQESDFRSHVVSSSGAIGLTQIKPSTAKILDAGVEVADLYNTHTNLKLGFRYLRRMLERFGSYNEALQAYRVGPTNYQSNVNLRTARRYAQNVLR